MRYKNRERARRKVMRFKSFGFAPDEAPRAGGELTHG